jgi:hypothetical protein
MQAVEEFMKEYFRVRAECYRESAANWARHMDRFIASGYKSIRGVLDPGGSEAILSAQSSETGAEVTTSGTMVVDGRTWRGRYQLVAKGDSWQIARIEIECVFCRGTGKAADHECGLCKGKGWTLIGPK